MLRRGIATHPPLPCTLTHAHPSTCTNAEGASITRGINLNGICNDCVQLSHHARNHYANCIHVQSESNHESRRTVLPQTIVVPRNVAAAFDCWPAGRHELQGSSKPAAATAGQSYLRLSASLKSQHRPGRPVTCAITESIRRYYKLLTRQTTRPPSSRSALPVPGALDEA